MEKLTIVKLFVATFNIKAPNRLFFTMVFRGVKMKNKHLFVHTTSKYINIEQV